MLLDRRREFLTPALRAPEPAESLLDRFNREYFCIPADQPELLRRAFQARYQVYCVENAFEIPQEHPDGLESDAFDDRSSHSILVSRNSGETIGTVRLILPLAGQPQSFALGSIVELSGGASPTPIHATGEVSRFSISKRFRAGACGAPAGLQARPVRPAEPLLSLGLIQGLVRMSIRHGITHWCAVMEPKLLRMLSAMGIHFTPVGSLIEYHGFRRLCHCELASVLKTVKLERPAFWDVITDGGSLT
jgi:N-acyl amino acid synthase of PEP-CTERM/exosortase system